MAIRSDQVHSVSNLPVSENANSLATVESVKNYEAIMVSLLDSADQHKVIAHLNNVPPLEVGDQILVVATVQGMVVTGRIRQQSESAVDGLTYKDGKLNLRAGKSIKIQSGPAFIELSASGKIKVDGKSIYSISEGRHRIQGGTIELN
ncbi:hypothetical protein MNBD_GAMMA12-1835 [hydrothermal vent metagenome]|uniref:Uncharacterized protein n=1 Tax=hydrothermal vent metagenome TaxID=652676 RepID=A0A3B0Z4F7_9ZZZZ